MTTAELQVLADDPDRLADIEDPAAAVIDACEHANRYLRRALALDDVSEVREAKAYAAALAGYTRQKELGQDAVLAAQEVIRRANLRIGLAIRDGQDTGTVESLDEARSRAARASRQQNDDVVLLKPRPTDYADRDELTREIYPLADAGEAAAERAIEQAKSEKNLSRANVIRHLPGFGPAAAAEERTEDGSNQAPARDDGSPARPATTRTGEIADLAAKGHSAAQIADRLGVGRDQVVRIAKKHAIQIPADKSLGRTRKGVDHARIVASTVEQMEGAVMALEVLDVTRLDTSTGLDSDLDGDLEYWIGSLTSSLRSIDRTLLQPLKKLNHQRTSQRTKGDQG